MMVKVIIGQDVTMQGKIARMLKGILKIFVHGQLEM